MLTVVAPVVNKLAQFDIEIRFIICSKAEIKIGGPEEVVCLRCNSGDGKPTEIELLVCLDCMQWNVTSLTGESHKMTQVVLFSWNEI